MSEDWARALRFAVLRLGLRPADFWQLTVREWRALSGGFDTQQTCLGRADLRDLLTRFPAYAPKE